MDLSLVGNYGQQNINKRVSLNEYENNYESNFGETVFIDLKHRTEEYKLYALDKKNKKHIELTKFPLR